MDPTVKKLRIPTSLLFIVVIFVILIIVLLNLFLFKKSTPAFTTLPIDPKHSAVNDAMVFYSLKGVVNTIEPKNDGYDLQLIGPSGETLEQKLFITSKGTHVVNKTPSGEKETTISSLKKGALIQLSYYKALKTNTPPQVTKIFILISQ